MHLYENILRKLILESEKLKNLPDKSIIKQGINIADDRGIEYKIEKVSSDGKSFLITRPGWADVLSYEQLINDFRRA
tara:strand:- start:41 stop:271 length:231 start_codon:yes stop_codon:yes gene_type:complete